MSILSKASFVNIPSGYGEDNLYSEVPNTTAGDFTFTRSTTGTRVNSDGYIEEVPWNEFIGSENYVGGTYGWYKNNCTITANDTTSPIGTNNASRISFTTTYPSDFRNTTQNISGINTTSIYVKYIDAQFMQLNGTNDIDHYCNYDILNGIVGNSGDQSSGSIEDVGGGWFRLIFTQEAGILVGRVRFINTDSLTSAWNANASTNGDFHIWGAQSVKGTSAKPYIKTTDRLNVPRLDYTNRDCPQLLIEKTATNLIDYSEDFTQWTIQSGVTATHNTTETLSPDGTNNATKFVGNGTSGVFKAFIPVSGIVVRSIYLKSVSGTVNVILKDPDRTITEKSLSVTTEWQRFELIEDNTTSSQGLWVDDIPSSGIYMWGAQLESKYGNQGYKPTSYIPTNGTSVTRNYDYFKSGDLTSVLNTSQGVFYLDFLHYDSIIYGEFTVRPTDNSSANQIYFRTQNINNPEKNITQFSLSASGTTYGNYQWNDAYINMGVKYAFAWDGNVIKHYINGVKKSETTATFSFNADFGEIKMSRYNTPNQYIGFHNPLRQVAYFNEMLTEDELETLTTPIATSFQALVDYYAYERL